MAAREVGSSFRLLLCCSSDRSSSIALVFVRVSDVTLSFFSGPLSFQNINMKVANVCGSSGVSGGRVNRPRRDVENEEVQMYLSKLKELVPFMPKHRKLSKLEVIQYVIDYICDLQEALETTPVVQISSRSPNRQPLGVLAPNTIVPPTSCSTQEAVTVPALHLEKVPTPSDTRPVSV